MRCSCEEAAGLKFASFVCCFCRICRVPLRSHSETDGLSDHSFVLQVLGGSRQTSRRSASRGFVQMISRISILRNRQTSNTELGSGAKEEG